VDVGKLFPIKSFGQLIRFRVVGVARNLGDYLTYLLLTWSGVDPKLVMFPFKAWQIGQFRQ